MQKVKKAAAQMDKKEIYSILNSGGNQIIINDFDAFADLQEKAILQDDFCVVPFFKDGTIIFKSIYNRITIYMILSFSDCKMEEENTSVFLNSARIEFFDEDIKTYEEFVKIASKRLYAHGKNWTFQYIGKTEIEFCGHKYRIKSFENSATEILKNRGQKDPLEQVYNLPNFEQVQKDMRLSADLFYNVMVCIDFLLKNPLEKKRIYQKRGTHKNVEKLPGAGKNDIQVFSLNSLQFRTANKKAAAALKSRKFTRYSEGWTVRGHYRHYKSGKTVYIESFEKGKSKKTKNKTKKYIL